MIEIPGVRWQWSRVVLFLHWQALLIVVGADVLMQQIFVTERGEKENLLPKSAHYPLLFEWSTKFLA